MLFIQAAVYTVMRYCKKKQAKSFSKYIIKFFNIFHLISHELWLNLLLLLLLSYHSCLQGLPVPNATCRVSNLTFKNYILKTLTSSPKHPPLYRCHSNPLCLSLPVSTVQMATIAWNTIRQASCSENPICRK